MYIINYVCTLFRGGELINYNSCTVHEEAHRHWRHVIVSDCSDAWTAAVDRSSDGSHIELSSRKINKLYLLRTLQGSSAYESMFTQWKWIRASLIWQPEHMLETVPVSGKLLYTTRSVLQIRCSTPVLIRTVNVGIMLYVLAAFCYSINGTTYTQCI